MNFLGLVLQCFGGVVHSGGSLCYCYEFVFRNCFEFVIVWRNVFMLVFIERNQQISGNYNCPRNFWAHF